MPLQNHPFLAEGHLGEVAFLLGQVDDLAYRGQVANPVGSFGKRRGSALPPCVA